MTATEVANGAVFSINHKKSQRMTKFAQYVKWLHDYNVAHPITSQPETPADLDIKTLWVPFRSGNRTACLDLNHGIGYDELTGLPIHVPNISHMIPKVEHTMGWNGNCCTDYMVIEVPTWWAYAHVLYLADIVCKELGMSHGGPNNNVRVLKANVRIFTIVACIKNVPKNLPQ